VRDIRLRCVCYAYRKYISAVLKVYPPKNQTSIKSVPPRGVYFMVHHCTLAIFLCVECGILNSGAVDCCCQSPVCCHHHHIIPPKSQKQHWVTKPINLTFWNDSLRSQSLPYEYLPLSRLSSEARFCLILFVLAVGAGLLAVDWWFDSGSSGPYWGRYFLVFS
jgi:hypothetical protein